MYQLRTPLLNMKNDSVQSAQETDRGALLLPYSFQMISYIGIGFFTLSTRLEYPSRNIE
jgi:hypothetical protein